jgi:starch synthase
MGYGFGNCDCEGWAKVQSKRLKIGYVMQADAVDMSIVSGPQLHVMAVIQGLRRNGHQVRLIALQQGKILWTDDLMNWQPGAFGLSETKLFRLGESVLRGIQNQLKLPFLRLFDSYRFSEACVTALAGYDILYERDSTISYGGLMAAQRLGVPLVLEINGDLVTEWKILGLQWTKAQMKVVHLITKLIYRSASHLVAVGQTIRQRIVEKWGLDPSHVSVVTNGADLELFSDTHQNRTARTQYALGNGPIIVFVGGFQPWHGLDVIVNGFQQFASTRQDAKLVLVGDGPQRLEVQNQVQSLRLGNQVAFVGRVGHAEVAQLLNTADVAVIYHRRSAAEIVETPLKLFEYMAAGKAIVAPDVRNMQRILIDHVNALLIEPDNPSALAKAFAELLGDCQLRESIGQSARQAAFKNYSWDRAVSEIEAILYRCLE